MSFAFIDPKARVTVIEGDDSVVIVGKLTKRQRGMVQQELLSLQIRHQASGSSNGSSAREDANDEMTVDAKMSAHLHELALLKAAVVDWDGPGFRFPSGAKVPCNTVWIEQIDTDAPIWLAVLTKINELNTPQTKTPAVQQRPVEPESLPLDGADPNVLSPGDSTSQA